jgi:phage terminase large subunit GpA-like protein
VLELPEPGPFRVSRTPYMWDIYESFRNPLYRQIVCVMGAQMGKTEAVFNVIGWRMDDKPTPVIYVGPTEKQVRSISNDRIKKMFKTAKTLNEKLEKGARDKVAEKFIAGTRLGFAHAGSATELASHPVGLVLVDERDRMVSTDEGDPVTMASARTKNFADGKVGVFSTPTIEGGSPIWDLFLEGTRMCWSWECMHCKQYFVPRLDLLQWPEGCTPQQARDKSVLVCPECGGIHHSHNRTKLNASGKYLPHRITEDDELKPIDEPEYNTTASFWVSGLASPWQTFGDIAGRLVAAYQSNDDDRIQAEVNTYGGETYKVKGDAPEWQEVAQLRQPYLPNTIPHGVQIITMAVDVQKRGLYYGIRGWGFMGESWGIDNDYIPGDTAFDNVWLLLQRQVDRLFGDRPIDRVFVDSGYNTDKVYEFARRNRGLVYAAKGQERMDRPIKTSDIDISIAGRVVKGAVKLYHVNADYFKSQLHGRLRWPPGEPGGFHLHASTSDDYCKQLVSESLKILQSTGKRVWIQHKKDNHYLDVEYLNTACAHSLQVHTLKPIEEVIEQKKKRIIPPSGKSPEGFVNNSANSWFRR